MNQRQGQPYQGSGQIPNQPGPNANVYDQQTPSPGQWAGRIKRYNPKGSGGSGNENTQDPLKLGKEAKNKYKQGQ